jgi:hypothetical protein
MVEFIDRHGAATIAMPDGIFGCPHEEGIDYPLGQECPARRTQHLGGAAAATRIFLAVSASTRKLFGWHDSRATWTTRSGTSRTRAATHAARTIRSTTPPRTCCGPGNAIRCCRAWPGRPPANGCRWTGTKVSAAVGGLSAMRVQGPPAGTSLRSDRRLGPAQLVRLPRSPRTIATLHRSGHDGARGARHVSFRLGRVVAHAVKAVATLTPSDGRQPFDATVVAEGSPWMAAPRNASRRAGRCRHLQPPRRLLAAGTTLVPLGPLFPERGVFGRQAHRHSAIRYVTLDERHAGTDVAILARRRALYELSCAAHRTAGPATLATARPSAGGPQPRADSEPILPVWTDDFT